jgi:hypothetical protein
VTGARLIGGPVASAVLGVVGVVGVVLVLALVLGRSGPAAAGGATPRSSFSLEHARAFDEFRLFSAGRIVDGHPLTAVLRRDDRANYVSFVYGDCEADDDEGCAPYAEVQVWPACRRNLALYDGVATRAASPVPERVRVRGVPGAFFESGTRLELETGRSLVVVFAASREQALRIAAELEALDGSVAQGLPLPLPADDRGEGGPVGC